MWYIGRLKNSEWYWIFLFAIFMLITGVNIFLMRIPLRSHKIAEGCIYIIFVAIQESLPIILYKKAYDESYKVSGGKLITHKREGRKTVRIDEIKTIVVTGNFEPNRRPVGDSLPKLLTTLKTASCQGGLFCLPSCC